MILFAFILSIFIILSIYYMLKVKKISKWKLTGKIIGLTLMIYSVMLFIKTIYFM